MLDSLLDIRLSPSANDEATALEELEKDEGEESIKEVFEELATDSETFPAEALEGEWI